MIIKDFDDILGNLSLPLLLNVNAKGADSPQAMSQQNRSDQLSMNSHILQHNTHYIGDFQIMSAGGGGTSSASWSSPCPSPSSSPTRDTRLSWGGIQRSYSIQIVELFRNY